MAAGSQTDSWLGKGLYSFREAGRLLGVPTDKLGRWAQGKTWIHAGQMRELSPALVASVRELDERPTLTFADLIELLFVKGFREEGLPLPVIRKAAEQAARMYNTDHPFTIRRFATDGREIFGTVAEEGESEHVMELIRGQVVIPQVLDRYMKQLEYDLGTGPAVRWWPKGRDGLVRIDPRVSFGAPTVSVGVPTETLFHAFNANDQDADAVARWYEVPKADVLAAVAFETELLGHQQAA